MFRSESFIFDGQPSEAYNLMIYFMDDAESRELSLGTDVEVIEDRVSSRINPIHYGVNINKSMSFPLTFGSTEYLEDYDVDAILSWLTGHQQYKWLEFVDGDHYVRYKCHLNNMQAVYINGLPTAFTCDVECDGQFAYEYPTTNEYEIDTTEAYIEYFNKSSYNGYLYPKVKLEFSDDCNSFSIINESDNNREFKIDYFDRVVDETSKQEYTYGTTLASEAANDKVNTNFIAWTVGTIAHTGSFSEIIKGDIDGVEMWVALPENGNKALYSEDKGNSWYEASPALPYAGSWTGCFGDKGFVAICTDNDQAIASYSQTGRSWANNSIELPFTQKWNKVVFVETEGFMPNQYVAIGDSISSMVAISQTGWEWSVCSLPVAQEWRDVCYGDDMVLFVGGNSNIAITTENFVTWQQIQLPKSAAWSACCYGSNGFILLADTLYGSGSRENIALKSADAKAWEVIEFPIGSWSNVSFNNGTYLAVGDRQFVYSFDGTSWSGGVLPAATNDIVATNNFFICPLGSNKYTMSNSPSTIQGTFVIDFIGDESCEVDDVYITAAIDETVSDGTYSSGITTLATHNSSETTGGEYVAITTDKRYDPSVEGVRMSAFFDKDTKQITLNYIVDQSHESVMNAPLTISIEYQAITTTDLGYDGLVVEFDNQNQIITTNKDTLNMYEYFNKRFLRFVKGLNKLKIKTGSGSCKVTITSEFLRKVGGR